MNTFASQISRAQASQYGLEAVQIIQDGAYCSPTGRQVVIAEAVSRAAAGTIAYPPETPFAAQGAGPFTTRIEVVNETTLSALRRLLALGLNPAALNFASATHPGGGFLSGARAQEEYLARSSALYACLRDQPMYDLHTRQADALYTSSMIYSPAVPVFRGDDGALLEEPYAASIITAAAPNASHLPYSRVAEITRAFKERIAKILWIGLQHGHDALVLGAWGCGAFGNDGRLVSRIFREALLVYFPGAYRQVTFAIVDWSDEKKYIGPFQQTFQADLT